MAGLLGLGGIGGLGVSGATPPAGLLGPYYNPADMKRQQIKQGLLSAGISMLTNGKGSTGEVIGQALGGGLTGAMNAGINYKNDVMGYNKMAQDMEEQKEKREEKQRLMDWVSKQPPEMQNFLAVNPEAGAKLWQEQKIKGMYPDPVKPTGNIQDYNFYVEQSRAAGKPVMGFEVWQKIQSPQGLSGGEIGTLPQGYELFTDPQTGARSMRAIKGGPEDKSNAAMVKADRAGVSQALVLDEINAAKTLVEGDSWMSPRTGITGKLMSNIDRTRAGALKNRLETIKANIGFDRLQAMREASPTGGALGPVSDFENRLLQAVMGSLEQAQEAGDIKYNLERLERIYDRVINQGIPEAEARQLYQELVTGQNSSDGWTTLPNGVKIRRKQ